MKPFILWLTMVFIISVYPLGSRTISAAYADKLIHVAIYAITCALFWTAFRTKAGRWALPLSVFFATAYGFLMEIAQDVTGHRTFSLMDGVANFAGATTAAILIWIKGRLKAKQRTG